MKLQLAMEAVKQIRQYLEMMRQSGLDVIQSNAIETSEIASPTTPSGGLAMTEPFAPAPITSLRGSEATEAIHSWKETFVALQRTVIHCTKCSELASTRKTVVFGSGNTRAKLVFVGEAPGYDEDVQGLPFVGRAGQLLTKIIESIGLRRQDVFICNVLKCRPPGNRNPLPNEVSNCEPYLFKQLEIICPEIICALGTFAAQTLLKTSVPISSLRGKFYEFQGAKLICTFHPAYLLRNPEEKRKVWEDMKMIRAELTREKSF